MKEYEIVSRFMYKKYETILRFRRNCAYRNSKKNRSYSGSKTRNQRITYKCTKELNSVNRRLNIAITRVEKPYGQPNILAEYIAL
ncbi:hypothetical protein Taro_013722 [Colocasia esculenta]|uniref:Uncharacterized protein n=1 Tax=Colocasia esculenta TaxID=4460 RepID=A0A843UJL3_COLES|nr:hypothetical protein [Colocasia esculenta]